MKKQTLHLIRLVGVYVFGLVMLVLVSACAGATQNPHGTVPATIVGKVQSVDASQHSVPLTVGLGTASSEKESFVLLIPVLLAKGAPCLKTSVLLERISLLEALRHFFRRFSGALADLFIGLLAGLLLLLAMSRRKQAAVKASRRSRRYFNGERGMKSTHGSWSQESVSAALQAQVGKVSTLQVTGSGPWDYPTGMMYNGVFLKSGTPEESLADALGKFPGSKTFLWYKSIPAEPTSLPPRFFANARAARVIPQIGFESGKYTLRQLSLALGGQGELKETNRPENAKANQIYREMSAWADYLKDKGPVIFRPLSEMNDANAAWEMGRPGNTPQDFATVWKGMRLLFDRHGANNLRWTFDVAAWAGANTDSVGQALSRIPPQYIDNMGMNPYTRDYKNNLETLCQPWMQLFKETGHGNTRLVVSEMGIANTLPDDKRKEWIRQAFAFARANHFASVTYFTRMDTNWRVDSGSQAFQALQQEIQKN